MRRLLPILIITAAFLAGSAAFGEVELFNGTLTGITTGGWGSGTAAASPDRPLIGNSVIRVSAQGLHEGGRIDFANSPEIVSEAVENEYIQFTIRFTTMPLSNQSGFSGPGLGVSSIPGLLDPRMASYYYQDTDVPIRAKVNTFRFVLVASDDRTIEACSDVPMNSEDGWFKVAVPLKVLGLKRGDSFPIHRILVFSDMPDNFAIGEINVIQDDTPITASAGDDQDVPVTEPVMLRAEAEGGASQLSYSWNFGDSGPTGEDATGQVVTHKYKSGGDFTVKLTVSDIWGIKSPVTVTTLVSVNDGS